MRSRVIPGSSPTIDRRDPVSRLNSVLLPTFGRPQTAISGSSRASALSVSVTICEASSSTSRQSSSSIRSRPATFSDRGVCRPTIPSAGRAKFGRAVAAGFFGGAPEPIAFRFSLSGDCFVTREALSAAARLVESTFRFRGSTAPVVGVARGARPFLGRVLACRCFFPNRFLLSRCAIVVPSLGTAAPFIHYRDAGSERFSNTLPNTQQKPSVGIRPSSFAQRRTCCSHLQLLLPLHLRLLLVSCRHPEQ